MNHQTKPHAEGYDAARQRYSDLYQARAVIIREGLWDTYKLEVKQAINAKLREIELDLARLY